MAVVGAGPAGLTAAHELRRLGHEPVVFEASERVGGKVFSVEVGGVVVELGAVIVFPSWHTVLGLVREFDVETARVDVRASRLGPRGEPVPSSRPKGPLAWLRLLRGVARYRELAGRASAEPDDGMAGLGSADWEPFGRAVEREGFEPIRDAVRRFFVGCGYGDDIDTVPAGYVMRLYDWPVMLAFLEMMVGREPAIVRFPGGYQQLWRRVAASLDVRLSCRVGAIHRVEGGFEVRTEGGRGERFDRVVVAIPPSQLGHVEGEVVAPYAGLGGEVEGVRYVATAWLGRAVPRGENPRFVTYFMGNHEGAPPGSIVMSLRPRSEVDVNVAYQFAGALGADELAARLQAEIQARGGRFDGIARQEIWPAYFPRLHPERGGVDHYRRVAALQTDEVLFAGGAIAFESVEHSAGHARRLVRRHYRHSVG